MQFLIFAQIYEPYNYAGRLKNYYHTHLNVIKHSTCNIYLLRLLSNTWYVKQTYQNFHFDVEANALPNLK